MEERINFAERRKRFMSTFAEDEIQFKVIPDAAAGLMYREFGVTIDDLSYIPIAWNVIWKHMMQYLHSQKADSFSVRTCGFTLEYMTELSESDKARNIVPEMYHNYIPIFNSKHHDISTGSTYNQQLIAQCNEWRSVNLMEVIDMVERESFNDLLTIYGINMIVSAIIFPLMAATYSAGVSHAITNNVPVNMYNWFIITPREKDTIILTPLASIKQGLKDDAKK